MIDCLGEKMDLSKITLGAQYSKERTEFKVYAKDIEAIKVLIYEDEKTNIRREFPMTLKGNIYYCEISEDLNGKFYTFLVNGNLEITDPYVKATSINSKRGYIFDIRQTDRSEFRKSEMPEISRTEAIIYELHIKDYTINENSGAVFRGKFLGLTEENTSYNNLSTGIDHLKELGITHVHLLPINDFLTVREEGSLFYCPENYNWGYDPEHFMSVENSYATNPEDPLSAIKDFKLLVETLHSKGIGVIVDVVLNHTYRGSDSNLSVLGQKDYYRFTDEGQWSNGSGVGNELASENNPTRKLIIDTLTYWAEEFKIDGFRFDLMSLTDSETVDLAVEKLREINPNILIYGEPWMALETTLKEDKIIKPGIQKDYALFNNKFRDAIRGDNNGDIRGFVQGNWDSIGEVILGLKGSLKEEGFTNYPWESINYVSSHDDLILYDKIKKTLPNMSEENILKTNILAMGIVLTSQGTVFIHEGNEFLRSKKGYKNTYNMSTDINRIDWSLKEKNLNVSIAIRDLISIRKSHKHFYLNPHEIQDKINILYGEKGVILFKIMGEKEDLLICYNSTSEDFTLDYRREYLNYDKNILIFNGEKKTNKEIRDFSNLTTKDHSLSIYKLIK